MKRFVGVVAVLAVLVGVVGLVAGGDDEDHGAVDIAPKGEVDVPAPVVLNPLGGSEIGLVYEAYLSPQQEAEEEWDVPDQAPAAFLSTEGPQVAREDRVSRGHGTVSFARDMSRAYVHLELANVNPDDVVLAHIHCGKPGQLGPILVDFGLTGDLTEYFADSVLTYEVTNLDLVNAAGHGHGIVGAFTAGCPITLANPGDRVRTVAGMATVAAEGELYFNIHTTSHTFYGDIRGQLHAVDIGTS